MMAQGTDVTGEQPTGTEIIPQKPTAAELLFEQYKLLEERRKYFGSQFMQTIAAVGTILSALLGLLFSKPANASLLRGAFVGGGIGLILLAFLAYRLGNRQDDCERSMGSIESKLESTGYENIEKMPTGAKTFGARKAFVFCLIPLGFVLVVIGFLLR